MSARTQDHEEIRKPSPTLKAYLEPCRLGEAVVSPYVRKMINEIVQAFPQPVNEGEMTARLGISRRWLQKLCGKTFGQSYIRLLRRLWVYQALHLMQQTELDNGEIALQLNYTEESSMARDFRKILGYSPGVARMHLGEKPPEELLPPIFNHPAQNEFAFGLKSAQSVLRSE